jgi:hypothetical protein
MLLALYVCREVLGRTVLLTIQYSTSSKDGGGVTGPICKSSVLSSGEAFGGVCFTSWLGGSPLLDYSGSSPSVDLLFPVRFPTDTATCERQSSVATGQGPRSAD